MTSGGITAVLVACNEEETIRDALESIRAQTAPPDEVIVVDDGSSDGTAELAASFEEVQLLRQQNAGPAAARNRGIAAATGEWIAFLDADDVWFPRKLEIQRRWARRDPGVAMWCGLAARFRDDAEAARLIDVQPQTPRITDTKREIVLDEFLEHNPVATSTVFVRRRTLNAVGGFDERFRGPEDYDLWLRIAAEFRMAYLDLPLAMYRYQPDRLSTDERRFLPQVLDVVRKAYGIDGVFEGRDGKGRAMAYHMLACAWSAAERRSRGRALGLFFRSLGVWPFPLGGAYRQHPLRRMNLLWRIVRG